MLMRSDHILKTRTLEFTAHLSYFIRKRIIVLAPSYDAKAETSYMCPSDSTE